MPWLTNMHYGLFPTTHYRNYAALIKTPCIDHMVVLSVLPVVSFQTVVLKDHLETAAELLVKGPSTFLVGDYAS
jgi:hypothetical protein